MSLLAQTAMTGALSPIIRYSLPGAGGGSA